MTTWPNKSPEPTAVGACRSAIAVHVGELAVAKLFSLGHITHHMKLLSFIFCACVCIGCFSLVDSQLSQ